MWERNINWLPLSCPWGPGLQPRHVPWPGIEPVTFHFAVRCPTNWATQARTSLGIYLDMITSYANSYTMRQWTCPYTLPFLPIICKLYFFIRKHIYTLFVILSPLIGISFTITYTQFILIILLQLKYWNFPWTYGAFLL